VFIRQPLSFENPKYPNRVYKHVSTSMSTATVLGPDEDGAVVDQRDYRSMIDSLLYLTTTRPDIQFIVCLCALLGLPTLFASDDRLMNLQVSQTYTQVWDLVFFFFFDGSC
jgi:hypothetical protein